MFGVKNQTDQSETSRNLTSINHQDPHYVRNYCTIFKKQSNYILIQFIKIKIPVVS